MPRALHASCGLQTACAGHGRRAHESDGASVRIVGIRLPLALDHHSTPTFTREPLSIGATGATELVFLLLRHYVAVALSITERSAWLSPASLFRPCGVCA